MAGGSGGRSLEETPTWAVAVVCFVLVAISIIMEYIIHIIGKWLKTKHKRALFESLEKIKSELMLLGFISLLLTVLQEPISDICISKKLGDTWHPCGKKEDEKSSNYYEPARKEHHRKFVSMSDTGAAFRRIQAGNETDKCAAEGKVAFVSSDGINQLHIFVFVLALFHVLYGILTMTFGRFKMKKWKAWERETRTAEYQFSNDPERFRLTRETSFGRRHMNFWSHSTILLWIVCFFRQFVRSVTKVDYLTLRHGFIMTHLAPQTHTRFNFQKYINRSLQEDFKVVVGISPLIWLFAVLFLLFNTDGIIGWYSYLWLPFIPLVIILLVGTKLHVIITKMGLKIGERSQVVKGVPLVELGDDLFWFNRPRFLLYLINFVLFQNAFQLAFFFWSWYEFGLRSCFHEETEEIIIKISMGILVQILCSYVTLPLYALVTQMGSTLKPTIFNERVATALRNWHRTARKNIKLRKQSSGGLVTPTSSRPGTLSGSLSPVHLLRHYKSDLESCRTFPRRSNYDNSETKDSPSTSYDQHQIELGHTEHHLEVQEPKPSQVAPLPQLELNIKDFSFDRIKN